MKRKTPVHWHSNTPSAKPVTKMTVDSGMRRIQNPTDKGAKEEQRDPLSMTALEFLISTDDSVACEGVKAVLNGHSLFPCFGADPNKEGLCVFLIDGDSGLNRWDIKWENEETLGVFLKLFPGRIWAQAYAKGKADAALGL